MSAASCKIILCGGKLMQAVADALTRTDEAVAPQIIAMLEKMAADVRKL